LYNVNKWFELRHKDGSTKELISFSVTTIHEYVKDKIMYIGTDTITRCLTCNLHYYINYGGKNWYLDSFPLSECYGFPLSFYLPTKLSPTSHCLHADNVAKYCNSNLNILVSVMISCESWCDHDNKWLCVMHLLTVL